MKLNDFYNEVTKLTDTDKTQINAAETKRVLAVTFDLLAKMDSVELADTISKGLTQAQKRAMKKK